jgi:subtilase family serine protease
MKIKNGFGLLIIFSLLIATVGFVPGNRRATFSPMIRMGPQAIPAGVTASTNPNYVVFDCQVARATGWVCYDPYQIRHAYGIDNLIAAGFDGRGKTIAIIDVYQSPNIVDQLNVFNTFYGLPSLNGLGGVNNPGLGTFTQVAPDGLRPFDQTDDNMIGWAGEISLDVEWAHAIAPGANITLVLGKSDEDADTLSAIKFAVDHRLGDVISMSLGEDESCMDPNLLAQLHQVFADATRKNITIFAASMDFGAAQYTCDWSSFHKAVAIPASDPLVTAVGGTELHAAGYCLATLGCKPASKPAAGTYQGEVAWNEPDSQFGDGSTGGGFSLLYAKPAYQKDAFRNGTQLGVPDVSYSAADYGGALTYIDIPGAGVYFTTFFGTSAGTPQWAAITAIADQKANRSLGFINTALYQIGRDSKQYAADFFDVKTGNNSVTEFDIDSNPVVIDGFKAGKNWDATTGLGSPKADNLVRDLVRSARTDDGLNALQSSDPHPNGIPRPHGHMRNSISPR